MGRQHDDRPLRHLVELVDEDGALVLQAVHDVEVVHDLLADVDGPVVLLEGSLDRIDGALDTGAIATRSCQEDGTHASIVPTLASPSARSRPSCHGWARVAVCRPAGLG